MQLKIRREGNSITYIYASERENIPLITLADGKIIIEKPRIYSAEVALSLASAVNNPPLKRRAFHGRGGMLAPMAQVVY